MSRKSFTSKQTGIFILIITCLTLSAAPPAIQGGETLKDLSPLSPNEIKNRLELYAPVEITYDKSVLSEPEKAALEKLIEAAQVLDEIFLRQAWSGNVNMKNKLKHALKEAKESGAPKDRIDYLKDLYHFYCINIGPWDRINDNEPFLGHIKKPLGANHYPEDMTKEEFEDHIKENPADEEDFRGYFTEIVRENGKLKAVPYSEVYKDDLLKAAKLQNEAADILTDPENQSQLQPGIDYTSFACFLRSRADAYLSNDYFQSDLDWMDVTDNLIDVTIGPYEVYEDALFGYKAAFEAFIAIRNPDDSRKLNGLKGYLQAMENHLPIPDEHKNPDRGSESPISVVDVVYGGGETKAGIQSIAFNLPNDERVQDLKGSKKVMLKNISKAKFDKILIPIANIILDPDQIDKVEFDIFFNNTLMHEFAHGLGPTNITLPDGKETTARLELKDAYSAIEEAKADILGLYNTAFLIKDGFFPKENEEKAYITFLPGFFRAIRFGATSAHGRANMIEFNFMKEKGAIFFDSSTEKFRADLDKMPGAVKELSNKLLMIEALGDYEGAKEMIEKYGNMPPEVEKMLKKFETIPTDVEPIYPPKEYLEG